LDASQFASCIALIRARFIAKLSAKIEEVAASLPSLAGNGRTAVDAVAEVYRRLHDVCGIGANIGLDQSAQAARVLVEGVLLKPFHGKRGLTAEEMARFEKGLDAFRSVAQVEMQSTDTNRSI
jgi:uncharacterized protein YerC